MGCEAIRGGLEPGSLGVVRSVVPSLLWNVRKTIPGARLARLGGSMVQATSPRQGNAQGGSVVRPMEGTARDRGAARPSLRKGAR